MPATAVVKVNGTIIAESQLCEKIDNDVYFPPAAIDPTYFRPSKTVTQDPLKGEAHYYDVVVDGVEVKDAAWYYPNPKNAFRDQAGFVTFCTYAPIMLVMRRVPLRFHRNKLDLSITTIEE